MIVIKYRSKKYIEVRYIFLYEIMKGEIREFKKEMQSIAYTILTLLIISRSDKPIYGYRIIKAVEELSNGRIKFKVGTLYPVLKKLERNGLVKSFWSISNGSPRKYYSISEKGDKVLDQMLDIWNEMVSLINDIRDNLMGGG